MTAPVIASVLGSVGTIITLLIILWRIGIYFGRLETTAEEQGRKLAGQGARLDKHDDLFWKLGQDVQRLIGAIEMGAAGRRDLGRRQGNHNDH